MKKLAIGLLAAAGIAMSVPANAQGVWVGAGPVGVGVGVGPSWGYYDRGYAPGYRSYAYDNGYAGRHCRIVRENFNGHIRKVRQCWYGCPEYLIGKGPGLRPGVFLWLVTRERYYRIPCQVVRDGSWWITRCM
ncbi:MAG: hypothetical protein WCB75_02605 [Pseudolabrys sp.]